MEINSQQLASDNNCPYNAVPVGFFLMHHTMQPVTWWIKCTTKMSGTHGNPKQQNYSSNVYYCKENSCHTC